MHNNAIGPELCGRPATRRTTSSRAGATSTATAIRLLPATSSRRAAPTTRASTAASSSTRRSMHDLLNPTKRIPKVTQARPGHRCSTSAHAVGRHRGKTPARLRLTVRRDPARRHCRLRWATSSTRSSSSTWCAPSSSPTSSRRGWPKRCRRREPARALGRTEIHRQGSRQRAQRLDRRAQGSGPTLGRAGLQTCTAEIENDGHRFGEDLSDADKKALIAFLATL